MAAVDTLACVGFGGWEVLAVSSGRSSETAVRCVRMRSFSVDREGCRSKKILSGTMGAGRIAVLCWDGERKNSVPSAVNDGALGKLGTGNLSSEGNGTKVGYGHQELEQYRVMSNGAHPQNSQHGLPQTCHMRSTLSRQYGASHQISLISAPMDTVRGSSSRPRVDEKGHESASRSGRRVFSSACLLGLVAFTFARDVGEVLAEETRAKPKTKGRPPSSPYDEDRLLEQNRRMQRLNNAPSEFPGFVREGFQVKVITNDKYITSKSGLIYYDMVVGGGDLPQDGQQVIFHYTGYNESGRRVDSSYQQGRPARTRLGIQGMIPGFEEGIKSMRAGGRRIIIIPPELGPPVGPSTFFSAKQFEVFDIELLATKDCSRRTLLFYSDVVCD